MLRFVARRRSAVAVACATVGALLAAALPCPRVSLAAPRPAVEPQASQAPDMSYPQPRRSDHVDVYHGVSVPDPYEWLENPDDPETRQWIEAENALTESVLSKIPYRDKVKQRLTRLWDYERYGLPLERGGKYFFTWNDGLMNQSVLQVADSVDGEAKTLLDPNTLSKDGTVSLAGWRPSEDGKLLAYGLASAGSDWNTWRIRDVETGEDLPEVLEWIKFSGVAWLPDGSGFYYSRYDAPKPGEEFTGVNYYQKLFFHKVGTDQSADVLLYERPDEKEWGFDAEVSENGEYLIVSIWKGTLRKNQILYRRLDQPDSPFVELLTGFDALYGVVHAEDGKFVVVTDRDAAGKKVVEIDLARPEPANWRTLIEESERPIESVDFVGGRLIVSRLADAKTEVTLYDREGNKLRELDLPGIGTSGGFSGRSDDKQTFYYFTSFTFPTTIFRFDLERDESEVFRAPDVDFDPSAFVTEQIFATSEDGTRVPIFVTRRKDVPLDGQRPTILYGYGGFDISLTPSFSVSNLVWLEGGGVYAVATLRGGGEYGRTWHEGGMLENKQNVFDDFLAAAERLVQSKYASAETLAIRGGSNGGLLVGAAMTQRPELFAAAAPAVGVMDMLRFHKFTIGWGWVNEYGSSDDPEQFRWLHAYSPYHNLREGVRYPATLVTTGDHDDRVVPAHSFKFAAELQRTQAPGGPPVLIRIETSAGHGAGKPISKTIEEAADVLSFLGSRTGWQGPK